MPASRQKQLLLSIIFTLGWLASAIHAQNSLPTPDFASRPPSINFPNNSRMMSGSLATPIQLIVGQNTSQPGGPVIPSVLGNSQGNLTDPLGSTDRQSMQREESLDSRRTLPGMQMPLTPGKELTTVPPLTAPNTSINKVGNGVFPEDATFGRRPEIQPLPSGPDREGVWYPQQKQWAPAAICHHPLYFQDTMLERHGHERFPCLQPYVSGVRFFGTLPLMPYLMTLHPPGEDLYNLGHFRPGSAAPLLRERPPFDRTAIGIQTLSTAGTLVALPL